MRHLFYILAFIALAAFVTAGSGDKGKGKAKAASVQDGFRRELTGFQIAELRKAFQNLEALNRPSHERDLNSVIADMKAKQQIDYILKHKDMAIEQRVVRVFLDETMKHDHLINLNQFCSDNDIWWHPVSLGIDQSWMKYVPSLSRWRPTLDDPLDDFKDAIRKLSLEAGVGPDDFR